MWELYAFWTLVPWLVNAVMPDASATEISAWSFLVIGVGLLGAIWGGLMSQRWGSARVAFVSLMISGSLCVLYPWISITPALAMTALMIWGFFVIADSAQFSAISSKACDPEMVASALSIQNSLGFLISIGSIVLLTQWMDHLGVSVVWLLIPGPLFGSIAMRSLMTESAPDHKTTV